MRSERHRPSVEIIGKIAGEEVIAVVRLPDGTSSPAEVHWYESHGVGRKKFKIKRLLGVLR